MAVRESAQRGMNGPQPPPRRRARLRLLDWLAVGAILATALGIYLPYALDAGWYYDDWDLYALFQDTPGGVTPDMSACAQHIAGDRTLACAYHASIYNLLGDARAGYHLVAIAFLGLLGALGYAVLRRCHVPRAWSALAGVLLVLFPGSDATRLWATAAIGQYVVALVLTAQLLALVALGRRGATSVALHLISVALVIVAMATYEIAMPLVALSGLLYLAAYREPQVIWRGALDLALVLGFLGWRLALSPPAESSGFVVERSLGESATRAAQLLEAAWTTWKSAYAPTVLGAIGLVVLAAAIGILSWRDGRFRGRIVPWLAALGISVAFGVASTLVYLTANDYYVPDLDSTFNRLNLPGSLPGAVAFVAILGLGFETIRRLTRSRQVATAAVIVVGLCIGWHQIGISDGHKAAWERSWQLQEAALDGYRSALKNVPESARIVGFDTPVWEVGYVPVFAASWDLRGAIDYTTQVDPPTAQPTAAGLECRPDGIGAGGVTTISYADDAQPVYFVSPLRERAMRVTSQAICSRLIERWGIQPAFAPPAP